jgi:hypothetical protein
MSFQILRGALQEDSNTEMRAEHANNGATFTVTNMIEYLGNVQRIPDWDFNGMRSPQRVKLEGCLETLSLRTCQPCSTAGNTS